MHLKNKNRIVALTKQAHDELTRNRREYAPTTTEIQKWIYNHLLEGIPQGSIDNILERMWNWKMNSAYEQAKQFPDFPKNALDILKELSENFGNCGWQDGKVFDELRKKNHQVAKMLGYTWNEKKDYWFKNK